MADDDLAAEWEAMSEEGGDDVNDDDFDDVAVDGGGSGTSARVLNQDEIDSLLGF